MVEGRGKRKDEVTNPCREAKHSSNPKLLEKTCSNKLDILFS